jgi:hypothetical protein
VKAERYQFEKHIDIVIRDTKPVIIRQNVEVKSQSSENLANIEKFFNSVHAGGHQDNVEVGHCLQ